MRLLKNSVIGFQGCKLNTWRDVEEAVAAGRKTDGVFNSIFGNPSNGVVQIRDSQVLFPALVRFLPVSTVWACACLRLAAVQHAVA